MPVINFSEVIRTMQGDPMLDVDTKKPVTLTDVALTALNMVFRDEQPDVKAKLKRYKLSFLIVDGGEQELKPEEVAELKALIGKVPFFSPLVIGRAYDILDSVPGQKPKELSSETPSDPVRLADVRRNKRVRMRNTN